MKPILVVKNLTKIFGTGCSHCLSGEQKLLKENKCPVCNSIIGCSDVNFEVYPGEILGIVGESGSGKSTVLNCIYGNYQITNGEIYYSGYKDGKVDISKVNSQIRKQLQNEHFGIVYQNPYLGLNFKISAESNVAEKLLCCNERAFLPIQQKAHKILKKVEIQESRFKDKPLNFSGGMQQRIQIAKALVSNPSLILLDEPTGGLDVSVQARILDLIRTIKREFKVAMIIVSHDMHVIRLLCERVIVMRYGNIVEKGLTDRVIDDPIEEYTQILVHSTL